MLNNFILNPFAAMEIVSFLFVLILLLSILNKWKKTELSTKVFALNLIFVLLGLFCDFFAISFYNISIEKEALFSFLGFVFGCATSPGFAYYCTFQANSKKKNVSMIIPRIILIANSLSIIIVCISYFTGKLFTNVNGELTASYSIAIMLASEIISTLVMSFVIILISKKIGQRTFTALLLLMIISIFGSLIEMLIPGVYISYTAISISALVQYVLLQSRLISEAEMREQIEGELSRTDVMTGLQNRRAYTELVDSLSDNINAGVGFFDVNGLKKTNDEKGHVAGDKLIISFANILTSNLINAHIFRISGDEFVALYIDDDKKMAFEKEMENIKSAIEKQNCIASMGNVYYSNMNLQNIINDAEKLMYEDKRKYYLKNNFDRRKS